MSHVGSGWSDGPEKEKRRWSFAKQRKSGGGAGGGARSSGPDAVAPAAAAERRSQLVGRPGEDARAREHRAAIAIQKTFRGYLVRSTIEPSSRLFFSLSRSVTVPTFFVHSYVREEYCFL